MVKNRTHLGVDRARDWKVYVDLDLLWFVLEVDPRQVAVVRFAQVKSELVVDRQVVKARTERDWIRKELLNHTKRLFQGAGGGGWG